MQKFYLSFLVFLISIGVSHSQVIVTPGTFPNICQNQGYFSQATDIIITEQISTDFQITSGTQGIVYQLQYNTGIEFQPGVGTVTFTAGKDIVSASINVTTQFISLIYNCPTNTQIDQIRISGLKVHALAGTIFTGITTLRNAGFTGGAQQNGNNYSDFKNHLTLDIIGAVSPTITLTGPTNYCQNDNTPRGLSGFPTGGTFSGSGVSGTSFTPSSAAVGLDYLYYNLSFSGCTYRDSTSITVHPYITTSVTSDDVNDSICPGQTVTFTGSPYLAGYSYTFYINGSYQTRVDYPLHTYTTNAILSNASVTVDIEYSGYSCQNITPLNVVVIPNPNPTFTLPSNFCSADNNYSLVGSPSGGTYSGSVGISGNTFLPLNASLGTNSIKYSVISYGCPFSRTKTTTVSQSPSVTLTSSDADNTICIGDNVTFAANTGGTANRYLFLKNSNGIQGPNSTNTFSINSLANGDAISVLVDNGNATCQTTSSAIVTTVGQYPLAKFTWQNTCGTNTINFTDVSTISSGSTIVSYAWDFDNNGTTDASGNTPGFTYAAANTYYARLTVTSDKGCKDDTLTRVYTLPGFTPTVTSSYAVNFASSNQGWAYDGLNPSWGWGVAPSAFNQGARKMWSTGQSSGTYNTNERSYLYGPCVNLSSLDKPMIALKLSSQITGKPAGAILEITTDNGLNWEKVGAMGFGQNWYNQNGIVSIPSSTLANTTNNNPSSEGWTDVIPLELSRLSLQKYAGNTSVRFRLNFTSVSDVNAAKYAGFALDSVFIGNRNKLVLLETFTNYPNCILCNQAQPNIDIITNKRKKDIAEINYHTSFPGNDNYNLLNTADPSARVVFYGISSTPYSFVNGNLNNTTSYNTYGAGALDTNVIDVKSLDHAKFKLDLSTNITPGNPGNITAATRITYLDNNPLNVDFVVYFAIIEDTVFNNVTQNYALKKMLPDAGGVYINKLWNNAPGNIETITQTWSDTAIKANKKFGVVAFIQNINTKEVYQAAYVKGSGDYGTHVVASVENPTSENFDATLYPNPANDEVHIIYGTSIVEDYKWEIYDHLGRIITSGINEKGIQGFIINTSSYAEGTYYLKIASTKNLVTKKLIIVR